MFKTETTPSLNNLRRIIWEHHRDKIILVGIGNILKGDDGFGPILISRLKNKIKAICLDAATVPENYVGFIGQEKPDLILLVDAIYSSNKAPGEISFYNPKIISGVSAISTHGASLSLLLNLLSQECSASIYLIGLNPLNLDFGNRLSMAAQQAVSKLEELFIEILS